MPSAEMPSAQVLKVLETAPNMYLVLSPDLYIITASDLYLHATETTREAIAGKHIFEAFPDNPNITDIDGVTNINFSLKEVLRTRKMHQLPVIRYDVPDQSKPGGFIEKYWHASHTPVLKDNGEIDFIIQLANNVTEQVLTINALKESEGLQEKALEQVQALNEELASSNEELVSINQELQDKELSLKLLNDGLELSVYVRTQELAAANEELITTNEELADTNHRLLKIQQELLTETQHKQEAIEQLEESSRQLKRTEEGLRMAIDAAQLATYYINATDRIFHSSPRLKEFFGFLPDEEVPYESAINQIHPDYRQRAAEMVEAAFTKGERFDLEYPVIGFHDGNIRWVRGLGTMQHYGGKDYFTGVLHDITENKADEQRKNDFIGMVSHELKTPLTSMKGYIQMLLLKSKQAGDVFTANALDKANKQVTKMTSMINGFLNVSRLESGKIMIDKQHFDIAGLFKEIEEETMTGLTTHVIKFAPVKNITVDADRDKIGQVITNFVSNAVKYSPSGSIIEVGCIPKNGFAEFCVKDYGLGIDEKDIEKLFDRFYRVEGNKHIAGFGIGLYLSAEIIHRHQGRIWVESEVGKGSTFYFNLPLSK